MNKFSEQARCMPGLPRNAGLLQIIGIRSQCIHFFDDASPDICEMLSQVRVPLPLDLFPKHSSVTTKQQLFLWQMQWVLTLSGSYSLNLSVRMLTSLSWITRLTRQVHQGRIVIGIQDPGSVMRLDRVKQWAARIAVKTLVHHGFRVWPDDVSLELFFV